MAPRAPRPTPEGSASTRSPASGSEASRAGHRLDQGWRPSAIRRALIRLASETLARLPQRASDPLVQAALGATMALGPHAFALRSRSGVASSDRAIDHHLASLFPDLDDAKRGRLTSGIQTNDLLAILVRRLRESLGDAWLEALVEPRHGDDFIALRRAARPTIVLSWHSGSSAGLVTGLARLERESAAHPASRAHPPPLLLRYEPGRVPTGWTQVAADQDPVSRGKALQVALKTLRAGGLVVILLDAMRPRPEFPHPALPLLGRMVRTSPGPAWLARLSGATIVPAHASWHTSTTPRVDLAFGPAIAHPDPTAADPDLAHTRAIYTWFESELRADPSTLWPKSLGHLARCPMAP